MGCDIHWLLERQHQDGSWIPVLASDMYEDGAPVFGIHCPVYNAERRDYVFFTLLANLRNNGPDPRRTLAEFTLPANMSDVTRTWLTTREYYHTQCWSPLSRILQWSSSWAGKECLDSLYRSYGAGEDTLHLMVERRKELFQRILTEMSAQMRPLHLPIWDEQGDAIYGADSASSHTRIASIQTMSDLKPVAENTARYFFIFDN